jgi:hypothetical protein
MSNFLTAYDLAIKDRERDALIKTLGLMESGHVKHVEIGDTDTITDNVEELTGGFNMGVWNCGTAACIGGTAEIIGKITFVCSSEHLFELFYPEGGMDYRTITVEQGAKALRNFLTTGEASWSEALK